MDRGMVSEDNVEYLRKGGRRYIVGTPKSQLRKYEQELLSKDWKQVHEGLQVRLCPAPNGEEVFILCRSAERQAKEQAMHERFERRIEEGLEKIAACLPQEEAEATGHCRAGRQSSWDRTRERPDCFRCRSRTQEGSAQIEWSKQESWREWARLSEGCYMLRSNVTDWTPEELWRSVHPVDRSRGGVPNP